MTTLANDNAFTVAANILLEAQRARYGKAPCRPRPARKHSNDDSIADSGFYSSSETSSASSIAGEPCRATQEMAHLSEALLRFYLDRAILSGDPPQDLAAMFGEEMLGSNVLDTFITSIGIATANPWDLGHRVATHVLQIFSKETLVGNCGLETDVEVYLCLILSITTPPRESCSYLERARKSSRKHDGEIPTHVRNVESFIFSNIQFPSSPTAFEHPRFFPKHLRTRSRASTMTMSSTTSRFSVASYDSQSKSGTVPATIIYDSEIQGSFAVTSPAHQFLHKILSKSPRRRLPFLWLLDTPAYRSAEVDPVDDNGIPTISRTPSTYSCSDSEGSASPVSIAFPVLICEPPIKDHEPPHSVGLTQKPHISKMNHLLAKAERASKFRTKAECSACGKAGLDYPTCPRCQEMWCSRECRLQGRKRHICVGTPA